jgi:hypothetical protein
MRFFDSFRRTLALSIGFASLAIAAFLCVGPGFAADQPAVAVPYGDWLSDGLAYFRDGIIALVVAGLGFAARSLPASAASLIETMRVEQLLTRAVDYGIAAARGAAKGQTLSIPIANEVIRKAIQYSVDNAPGLAAKYGPTLQDKIIARLSAHPAVTLDPAASADNLRGEP